MGAQTAVMGEHVDWGHGPNRPVAMYTEDQIREAMGAVMHTIGDQVKIEAVLARLKETRDG
jgi:hypothetical protein